MPARPRPSATAAAIFASLPGRADADVVMGEADVRSLMEISFEASVATRPRRQSGRRPFRGLLARVKFCKDAKCCPKAYKTEFASMQNEFLLIFLEEHRLREDENRYLQRK